MARLRPAGAAPEGSGGQGRVAMLTEQALLDADRFETPLGAVAMALAAKLDDPGMDTGSSVAALARQLQASLDRALEGAHVVETPAERLRKRHARRVGAA